MNNKKKTIIAIIITMIVGIMTIAGSFALWTAQVGNNIQVSFNTVDISTYVEYTEGVAVFNSNLEASDDYTDGNSTTFTLKTKNSPPYNFYASINLKVNGTSTTIKESRAIKWTVTFHTDSNSTETVVAESDFVALSNGDTIMLVPNIRAHTTKA